MGLPGADADRVMALMKQHHMDVVGPPLETATPPPPPTPPGTARPPAKVLRIGVLAPGCGTPSSILEVFLQGLRARGYVEGQTLAIEWRNAEGRAERFAELAAEMVRLPVT